MLNPHTICRHKTIRSSLVRRLSSIDFPPFSTSSACSKKCHITIIPARRDYEARFGGNYEY